MCELNLFFLKRTSQIDVETMVRESPEFTEVLPGPQQAQGVNSQASTFLVLRARELVKPQPLGKICKLEEA